MSITKETVTKVARLARIEVADERKEALAAELSGIMQWIEQLQEVNTDDVEPLTSVANMKAFEREDVINDGDMRDDVLANAPGGAREGFFVVPKVVE